MSLSAVELVPTVALSPAARPRACPPLCWVATGALVMLAVVAAFTVDGPVAHWMYASGWEHAAEHFSWFRRNLPFLWPGNYACTILIAIGVLLCARAGGRGATLVLLAGALTVANTVLKWLTGRERPSNGHPHFDFNPFADGLHGFFVQRNLSLPSGDAALAVATACALSYVSPRWSPAWWGMAIGVAFQRVAQNSHHVSDVLAAAALGVVAFHLARRACNLTPQAMESVLNATATPPAATAPLSVRDREVVTAPPAPGAPAEPYVSVVIPCYNEEEVVPELFKRLESSLAVIGRPFEVVIVDDGSTDSTPRLLAEGMARLPWLRVFRMAKNGGQSAAFEAGFEAARGQVIATIDADLQNDPEEIPRLLPMLDEHGVDMITGWRKDRQDTRFRRWQSRQANRIRNWISQETVNDSASSLKLYRAYAIKGLRLFNGAHRFFPTLVKMRGYKVLETPVKHSHRFAGTAKYGFGNRALRAFIDLIGIRWMKSRYLRYLATEIRPEQK
ncbi:MAG TPA: glycosyltransferase [Tepidisphaeraceae bacterium]|nr:glycosyltransferase [Tepidisphaeraceae bacterium]